MGGFRDSSSCLQVVATGDDKVNRPLLTPDNSAAGEYDYDSQGSEVDSNYVGTSVMICGYRINSESVQSVTLFSRFT